MRTEPDKLKLEITELKPVSASKIGNLTAQQGVANKETIDQQSFISSFKNLSVYHILKQQIFAKN